MRNAAPPKAEPEQILVSALIEDAVGKSEIAGHLVRRLKTPESIRLLSLGDLLGLIQFFGLDGRSGTWRKSGGSFRRADLESMHRCCADAISLLSDWPIAFEEMLRRRIAKKHKRVTEASISDLLGRFYIILFERFGGEQFRFLHDAFAEFMARKWTGPIPRRVYWSQFVAPERLKWCDRTEAKKLLGAQPEQLVLEGKIRGSVHVAKSGTRRWWFDRDSIRKWQSQQLAMQRRWMPAREVCEVLGIDEPVIPGMVSAGLITRRQGTTDPNRFSRRDVSRIVSAFERHDVPLEEVDARGSVITLGTAKKRFLRFSPFIRAVLDGLLIPVSRTDRERGIMGYQFLEPELRWIAKHRPVPNFGPEFMNMKEAAQYLQTTSPNIKGLVDENILIRLPREYGGSKIPSAQVRDFGESFVSLESMSRCIGSHGNTVLAQVKMKGIPILSVRRRKGCGSGSFLSRKSAMKFLKNAKRAR